MFLFIDLEFLKVYLCLVLLSVLCTGFFFFIIHFSVSVFFCLLPFFFSAPFSDVASGAKDGAQSSQSVTSQATSMIVEPSTYPRPSYGILKGKYRKINLKGLILLIVYLFFLKEVCREIRLSHSLITSSGSLELSSYVNKPFGNLELSSFAVETLNQFKNENEKQKH